MANAWPYQETRIATGLRFMLGIAMFPRRASTGNGTVCIDMDVTISPGYLLNNYIAYIPYLLYTLQF